MAVLTLVEVRDHLNITTQAHDYELNALLGAAVAAIGERVGPLEPVARTVRVRSTVYGLRVPGPVVSLTTVVDSYASAVLVGDLYLDTSPGLISYSDGRSFSEGLFTVTYMAGRTTCPDDLLLAVLELVRHLWGSQRSPALYPGSSVSEGPTTPGAAYLMPFRVQELIAPHMQIMVA